MEEVELSQAELDALPEYRLSLPTVSIDDNGTVVGVTKWKRNISDTAAIGEIAPEDWYMGQYPTEMVPGSGPEVPIHWRKVVIVEE